MLINISLMFSVQETFRKYPAVLYLTRKCSKTYCEPNKNIVIEKGTLVLIPLHGIHHDEEYYPEPEKFDPERFNDTNKKARHHYKHLPFGAGPRMCIGMFKTEFWLDNTLIFSRPTSRFVASKTGFIYDVEKFQIFT